MRISLWFDQLLQDARYALGTLRSNSTVSAAVVLARTGDLFRADGSLRAVGGLGHRRRRAGAGATRPCDGGFLGLDGGTAGAWTPRSRSLLRARTESGRR
jgi:hypothetical protein